MYSSGTFYLYFIIKALTAEIKLLMDLFFSKLQTQTHRQVEIVGKKNRRFELIRKISDRVGRWWAGGMTWASSLRTISYHPFPASAELDSYWVGRKAMTTPPCLESKDQGWSATVIFHLSLPLRGQGSPRDKRLYLGNIFWGPVEHLSVFLVPKEGQGAHEMWLQARPLVCLCFHSLTLHLLCLFLSCKSLWASAWPV